METMRFSTTIKNNLRQKAANINQKYQGTPRMLQNNSDFTISNMTDNSNFNQIIQTLKNENAVLKKKLSIY